MEEKLATDTIRYLYSIEEFFKTNFKSGEVQNQLRQNLLQKARVLELKKSINLSKKTFNSKLKCPKCCMPRDQGLGSFKLCKNKISRFQKKMTKKLEAGEVLTKYQEKYLKKVKSQSPQILEIKCRLCGYKVVKDVVKPNVVKDKEEIKKEEISVGKKGKIKNKQKSKVEVNKNIVKNVVNNKQSTKKKLNNMIQKSNQTNISKKLQSHQSSSKSYKSNINKVNKMNILLSSTSKIKNTGLKDFIKSIT